jgi:hypothetical protein
MENQPPWSVLPCFSRKMYGKPSLKGRQAEVKESRLLQLYNFDIMVLNKMNFTVLLLMSNILDHSIGVSQGSLKL